ncbi:MAG: pyruvate dehydrogenase complex E1 component subunit beta [Myxococcales bacterium]|nr:pyruvate dehydrogenase complex E1 component subunit beta [Myxococcales bacterium]
MPEILFREALNQAMVEEMERDPDVFLMGEEVAEYNGAYKVSKGMLEKFGPKRVVDTPIVEAGFTGLGIGAAMMGLRPIVEMMTFNFAILVLDQMINHAAKMYYMTNGQYSCPMVLRGAGGAPGWLGAQHSQSLEAQYAHIPGLKVMMPSTPHDAKGMLKAAIRDDDPVVFIESELMYGWKGEVPSEEYVIPIGEGDIKRQGTDLTLISWSRMIHTCLEAADALAEQGYNVEVVDPRTLRPLDEELLFASVRKTNRVVLVEEGWPFASVGSGIINRVQRECFDWLDAPIEHVASLDTPMPYAPNLEKQVLPDVERVVAACKRAMYVD